MHSQGVLKIINGSTILFIFEFCWLSWKNKMFPISRPYQASYKISWHLSSSSTPTCLFTCTNVDIKRGNKLQFCKKSVGMNAKHGISLNSLTNTCTIYSAFSMSRSSCSCEGTKSAGFLPFLSFTFTRLESKSNNNSTASLCAFWAAWK